MNNFQQINETGILIQIWDSGAVLFLFLVFRLRSEKINVKNLQSTENTTWIIKTLQTNSGSAKGNERWNWIFIVIILFPTTKADSLHLW